MMHTTLSPEQKKKDLEKYLLILTSVVTTAMTLILTGYASYISNSVTLFADFLKCLVEFLAIFLAFFVIEKTRKADRATYNYGFGKLEQLSSTIVAFAMFCSALLCFGSGVQRAIHPQLLLNGEFGLGLATLSVLGNGFMWYRFRRLSEESSSPVVDSQRVLFLSKTLASLIVLSSVSLSYSVHYVPALIYTDALGSLMISMFLLYSAYLIASDSVGDLVDRSVDEAFQQIIMGHLVQYEEAFSGFHGLRTRRVGTKKMIQIHISFDDNLTIGEIRPKLQTLKEGIEKEILDSEVVLALNFSKEKYTGGPFRNSPA